MNMRRGYVQYPQHCVSHHRAGHRWRFFPGFNHFAQLNMMTGYAKSKGIPAPALAVGGSGVLLFLGGLSLLLGYHPTIGAALLVIFLLGVSFGIHNFWTVQDQQAKLGEMTHFLKNMAILGLLLMTLAIPRPWLMSLGH
jgi:putative oxidoreductase